MSSGISQLLLFVLIASTNDDIRCSVFVNVCGSQDFMRTQLTIKQGVGLGVAIVVISVDIVLAFRCVFFILCSCVIG